MYLFLCGFVPCTGVYFAQNIVIDNSHKASVGCLTDRILSLALSLATFSVSLFKSLLDSFQFSGFLTASGNDFAQILDFVVDLLEYVPVLGRQVIDEVSIREEIVTNEICGQLAFDICILDILVHLGNRIISALILTLCLGIVEDGLLHGVVELSAFQNMGDLVTNRSVQGLCRVYVQSNAILGNVAIDLLAIHRKARFLQLGVIGEIKKNALIC